MDLVPSLRISLLIGVVVLAVPPFALPAQPLPVPDGQAATSERDGQHDFDFELGSWNIHLKRRLHPLTGSNSWVEFDGTSVTRKVWDGRSDLEEFETDGAAGHIEGLTLRLYDPHSHQWRLYWANSKDGLMAPPQIGQFHDGRGEFLGQDTLDGKMIFVKFVWSAITPNSAHFEQSFSSDGGQTWEVNWITDQTRVDNLESAKAAPTANAAASGQHDFDFEFGSWKAHLKRLAHPLSGADSWVEYQGSSIVRKVWNGHANLGELEVDGPGGHLEGLTLRLFNPPSHQWNLYWANSKEGILATPTIGEFKDARGEFFDQEDFQGKAIFVRFLFSDISSTSFRTEQAFSSDGAQTWETNWVATFTREKP